MQRKWGHMATLCTDIASSANTTASNRSFKSLLTLLVMQDISAISSNDTKDAELMASPGAIKTALDLIAEVPSTAIGRPDVSPYFGELHLTWRLGNRQVVLMTFPNRTPLIHHHPLEDERPIQEANPDRLTHWLSWMRA
jgi:hypothetical protein